jgi:hypothetical protein
MLHGRDVKKLLRAGFRIFRRHTVAPFRIVEMTHSGWWRLNSSHATKADMERTWRAMMQAENCIGDDT